MKKLFSVLLAAVMVLGLALSAFASGETYFKALDNMNGNYEAVMEVSMTVDKPFEILDVLAEYMEENMYGSPGVLGFPSNLKTFVESIFDTTSKMEIKVSVSEDYKKIAMEMSGASVLPLKFGENLKNTTEMNQKMWVELDFSDIEKPVYRIIQLNPFIGDKYLVMDMTEMMGEEMKTVASLMNVLLSEEGMELIRTKSIEAIKNHAEISGSGGNIKLYFDDKAAKGYLTEVFKIVIDLMKNLDFSGAGIMMPYRGELDAINIEELLAPLMDINIFGKDGITYDMTVKNGLVSDENMKLSIDLNLYDIISVFAPESLEDGEVFITKENSQIAFSINTNVHYKSVNKEVKVNFPTLTPENSYDYASQMFTTAIPEMSENVEMMQFPAYYSAVSYSYPIEDGGKAYIPVRALFSAYGVADEDILWDNGNILVKSNGACEYFNEISFACGETKAVKDGSVIPLADSIINYKGQTCVSGDFVEKVLGGRLTSVYFYASEYNWEEITTEYMIEHAPSDSEELVS